MNETLVSMNKEKLKEKLAIKINTLEAELKKAQTDLEYIDYLVVIQPSAMKTPFKDLGLKEKNFLFKNNRSVYDWFEREIQIAYTNIIETPNKEKTLQDYINAGQPQGELNFFDV